MSAEVGLSNRIRGALARGPATTKQLAERLGVDVQKVTSIVQQLIGRTGGVYALSDTCPRRYALTAYGANQSRSRSVNTRVAGPIVIPQFRWGSTRLG